MPIEECRSIFDTMAMGTPAASISDAAPCRRSCSRTCRRPAAWLRTAHRRGGAPPPRPRAGGRAQDDEPAGDVLRPQRGAVLAGEDQAVVLVGVPPSLPVDVLP